MTSDSTVTEVLWQGAYYAFNTPQAVDAFTIRFYQDTGSGGVGTLVDTFNVGDNVNRANMADDISGVDLYGYNASLGTGINLDAGNYWVSIFNNTSADLNDNWYWGFIATDGSSGGSSNGTTSGCSAHLNNISS